MTARRPKTAPACRIFHTRWPVKSAQASVPEPMTTIQNRFDAQIPPMGSPNIAPVRPPMMSMIDAQQTSWITLRMAAKLEPRIPKDGRTDTIDGMP